VLVLAASSGVGSAAIQIAKMFHCRVIATAGGEAKLAKARELGADHVIDHYRQDISAEVRKITGKRGVDVAIEHVGTATWQKSLESLAPAGRLVTCGATTGFDAKSICVSCSAASSRCWDRSWGPWESCTGCCSSSSAGS
jgi:NADPH:quinone reductase-like Zn-dependent oxidoreductase